MPSQVFLYLSMLPHVFSSIFVYAQQCFFYICLCSAMFFFYICQCSAMFFSIFVNPQQCFFTCLWVLGHFFYLSMLSNDFWVVYSRPCFLWSVLLFLFVSARHVFFFFSLFGHDDFFICLFPFPFVPVTYSFFLCKYVYFFNKAPVCVLVYLIFLGVFNKPVDKFSWFAIFSYYIIYIKWKEDLEV